MDKAVKLYCDTLGFELKEHSSEWSVTSTKLGDLTLYKTPKITPLILRGADATPISLHVRSFEEAAEQLEKNGYSVKRKGKGSGTRTDPWGNLLRAPRSPKGLKCFVFLGEPAVQKNLSGANYFFMKGIPFIIGPRRFICFIIFLIVKYWLTSSRTSRSGRPAPRAILFDLELSTNRGSSSSFFVID